jgi:hypothetical protein
MNRLNTDPRALSSLPVADRKFELGVNWSDYEKGSERYANLLLALQSSMSPSEYESAVRTIDRIQREQFDSEDLTA